jgi:hypothetical protein
MVNPANLGTIAGDIPVAKAGRRRGRFFLFMSALILVVVLLGFGPSFYLRPLYEMPQETPIVFIHGGLMTAWFVVLVAQTSLVAAGRVDIHRKLGIAGVALACVAIVLNVIVSLEFGARMAASGDLGRAPSIIWGNFATLSVFATCVALAVWHRKKPDTHRRLMLLACISMTPQAWSRFPLWWPSLAGVVNALSGVLALLATLAIYDLVTTGRVRLSTVLGGTSLIGLIFLSNVVESSEFGIAFIRGLG